MNILSVFKKLIQRIKMLKSTNLNLNERMKIITADMQIKSSGKKVTYTELSKQAYFDKRTSNLCQNRKYST